jgi:hypothetical protein
MDRELYAKLQAQGYELIIDEVLETVTIYKGLNHEDLQMLQDQGYVSVDPLTWRLRWSEDHKDYAGEFVPIKNLCETGSLVVFRDKTFIWEFPSEFLRCFSNVTVATYMFDASPFRAYLKAEGFTFNVSIRRGPQCRLSAERSGIGPTRGGGYRRIRAFRSL